MYKIFGAILALLLSGFLIISCSTNQGIALPTDDEALLNDDDIAKAILRIAEEEITIVGTDGPDYTSASGNTEALDANLSTQAVIPGPGWLCYARHNPTATFTWKIILHDQTNDNKITVYKGTNAVDSVACDAKAKVVAFIMRTPSGLAKPGKYNVFRYILSKAMLEQLTANGKRQRNISMSANTSQLVWDEKIGGIRNIKYRTYFGPNLGDFNQFILFSGTPEIAPSVTSDGYHIALVRKPVGGPNHIYVYDIKGGFYSLFYSSANSLGGPSAVDGGQTVAWLEITATDYQINWRSSGGAVMNIWTDLNFIGHPFITRDGKWITYVLLAAGSRDVYTRHIASGTFVRSTITVAPNEARYPYWQLDTVCVICP